MKAPGRYILTADQNLMRGSLSKFLCCLLVSLQVLTSFASAQGLMLCVPSDGDAHIEDRVQQLLCAKGSMNPQQDVSDKAAISDSAKPCFDLPVAGEGHGALRPAQQNAGFVALQFVALLPLFLQVIPNDASTLRAISVEASADRVPDATLSSLSSVILVI